MTDTVIILHGLGRSINSMRKIGRAIEKAGYQTRSIDYPSTKTTIEPLIDLIAAQLPDGVNKLHFVGHSLGGILAKRLMKQLPDARQGRIVQLGSPNFGSEIAERVAVFGALIGPALAQLTPHGGEDDSQLVIGAIAGTAAIPAYGLLTGIEGKNDGKVSVESAWGTAPANRRIALPVAHSTMMNDPRVIAATIAFLKTGTFPHT